MLIYQTGTFTTANNGTITINSDGSYVYIPTTNPSITSDSFEYFVTNADGYKTSAFLYITILNRTYAITPNKTTVNEGESVTWTIATTNVSNSSTLWFTNSGTTSSSDFTDLTDRGSVIVNNNIASFTKTLQNDAGIEGPETIIMQVRTDSLTGSVVATSPVVTVIDRSCPASYTARVTGRLSGGTVWGGDPNAPILTPPPTPAPTTPPPTPAPVFGLITFANENINEFNSVRIKYFDAP
jgi:hypothetical protein